MDIRKGLTGNQIKIIGIVLMTINHFSLLLYPNQNNLIIISHFITLAGPMVAPTFFFLGADGFHYTRNKKKYLLTLLIGFWITSLMKFILTTTLDLDIDYQNMLFMNIFGGLFQAALAMYLYDKIKIALSQKRATQILLYICMLLSVLGSMFIVFSLVTTPTLLSISVNVLPLVVEGAPILPILGLLLYICREKKWLQIIIALVYLLPTSISDLLANGLSGTAWPALLFLIPVIFYNGKRGAGPNKYFFYAYYPSHIAVFILLNYYIFQHLYF
ncbi:TraX family protein [Carnobacterium maltaromaticum]|uniref:TraX family protein n=1 Tax=Carnobacterium maltaromaticum TaxID=2751 RepID=UPI00295E7633|nr:TraX family protein [Carnobacterium maltaromaticum]